MKHSKFIILFIFVFSSCTKKKIIYYDLNLIMSTNFKSDKSYVSAFRKLCNYTICGTNGDTIFVPDVKIRRVDLEKIMLDSVQIEYSSLNKFKKKWNFLSPKNLIDNYNKFIPNLSLPDFMIEKSEKNINLSDINIEFPNSVLINVNDSFNYLIDDFLENYCNLMRNNNGSSISIVFYSEQISTVNTPVDNGSIPNYPQNGIGKVDTFGNVNGKIDVNTDNLEGLINLIGMNSQNHDLVDKYVRELNKTYFTNNTIIVYKNGMYTSRSNANDYLDYVKVNSLKTKVGLIVWEQTTNRNKIKELYVTQIND